MDPPFGENSIELVLNTAIEGTRQILIIFLLVVSVIVLVLLFIKVEYARNVATTGCCRLVESLTSLCNAHSTVATRTRRNVLDVGGTNHSTDNHVLMR
jgi:hypothetical protein